MHVLCSLGAAHLHTTGTRAPMRCPCTFTYAGVAVLGFARVE